MTKFQITVDNWLLATTKDGQNQKQANKGSLAKVLKLQIDAKVMLTVNLDTQNHLIN